jgi:hypothetical protein
LINNGLQYSRAITRVTSDTPISIATRIQATENAQRHIQHDMERLTGEGWSYSRAATRAVASDRLPVCMERLPPTPEAEVTNQNPHKEEKGTEMWSLNVRGMSTKESLEELEQEAELSGNGILLIQETWRPEHKERINIGKWTFFGTGNKERPMGEWNRDTGAPVNRGRFMVPHLIQNHGNQNRLRRQISHRFLNIRTSATRKE